jgi:hypothetical protein
MMLRSFPGRSTHAVAGSTDSAASAEYYRRRRRTLYAALKQAVRSGSLSANPLDGPAAADWKAPAVTSVVDRRRVPNPAQMRELLAAIGKVVALRVPGWWRYTGACITGCCGPPRRCPCARTSATFRPPAGA